MSRVYFLGDARGERRVGEEALPLKVGGAEQGDLVVPGLEPTAVAAYIALADGHAYVQPADDAIPLYHNHERLAASRWLKSGDRVQVGEHGQFDWLVKGDQVFVTAGAFASPATTHADTERLPLRPPVELPPPATVGVPSARSSLRRRWTVAAAVALLAMVSTFVLLAVPVSIEVTPAPERQAVHGFPPPVPLAGRLLLLPGTYRLEARRAGYAELTRMLDVRRGEHAEFTFQLEELPGRLAVTTDPPVPFVLRVDDVEVAPGADGRFGLARGMRRVEVSTARHLPVVQETEIAGYGAEQELAFALRPAWAEIAFGSEPAGATVTVDGETLGVTPLRVELMQGVRRVELALAGHKPVALDLPVEAGVAQALDAVPLPPADGVLALGSEPAGATVTVDEVFRGTTPLELTLSSDRAHRLQVALPGHRPATQEVRVAPDTRQPLTLVLEAELGTLFVSARPADAELLVDGRPVGSATQRLRLSARPHVLEFRKQGYASETVEVTPRAGASQRVDVTLKTVAAAREAATPTTLTSPAGTPLRLLRPGAEPFRMGASRREAGRRANESPRLVRLERPFYLGVAEVTNAEYRRFKAGHDSGSAEGVGLNGDTLPAVNVGWDDAARYCNWLSRQEGLPEAYVAQGERMVPVTPLTTGYRLPTEAEWAYVARVHGRPQPVRYPWPGGAYPPTGRVGNYADRQIADTLADTVPGYDDGFRGPAPVGTFPAQPEGYLDLGGNVAEWVHDYYAVYPGEAEKLVLDPSGPADGQHHVVRGASWRFGSITELRLTYRDYSRGARDDLGFRIARYAR